MVNAPPALPKNKGPGTHFIGGWVGPRAGLDPRMKRIVRDVLGV